MFLEPKSITTPIGESLPISLGVALPLETNATKIRAATIEVAAQLIVQSLETAGLQSDEQPLDAVLYSLLLLWKGVEDHFTPLPPAFMQPKKKDVAEERPIVGEYPDRNAYQWVHTIAEAYHWSRAEILALHPVEAARFVQEIYIEQQQRREFEYSLSEVAYDGKGKFKSLPKPAWMEPTQDRPIPKLRTIYESPSPESGS